jgi:hypothetical protein
LLPQPPPPVSKVQFEVLMAVPLNSSDQINWRPVGGVGVGLGVGVGVGVGVPPAATSEMPLTFGWSAVPTEN